MNRGDVFAARLDPTEGSEQAGTRPVVIVSRDAINRSSGTLPGEALREIDTALLITLDLPGQ